MRTHPDSIKYMKKVLEGLPAVASVREVCIKNSVIEEISLDTNAAGEVILRRLDKADAPALYDFYVNGLSDESRNLFPPHPLFSLPLHSEEELASRIINWQKEDDWTFLKLTKDDKIIGVSLLKRYKTARPVSGLAVREEFRNRGLGLLLQTIVTEQARLLKLGKLYASVAPYNTASLKIHRKCGLKETGRMVPHTSYKNGIKEVDRYDIEFIIEFNQERLGS